jgi:hypothetical protein
MDEIHPSPRERAGLCPPHGGKPSTPLAQESDESWRAAVEAQVAHDCDRPEPSRRRRRRERRKRQSSPLDGRWHARCRRQRDEAAAFERAVTRASKIPWWMCDDEE